MFSSPKSDACKEDLETNISNIRAISKALQGKIHVESSSLNSAKFIFVVKIEMPPAVR